MDLQAELARLTRQIADAEHRVVETACEKMLTDPRGWGILVITDEVGRTKSADLNQSVPFGTIYVMKESVFEKIYDRALPPPGFGGEQT